MFKYGGYFILAYLNRPNVLIDAYGTFKAIPFMVNYSLWKEEADEVDNDLTAAQFSVRF